MKKIGKNAKLYLIGMIIGGITLGLTTVVADTIINSTNVSYKTSTVKAALDDLYGLTADDVWQKIYPVGSIYISAVSTSPATLFGGTWVEFGKGRTLVGVDTSDTSFNTVEKTGGSKTKTIAVGNLPAHTHGVNINTNSTNHNHGTINTTNNGAHAHSVLWGSSELHITPATGGSKKVLELTAWKWVEKVKSGPILTNSTGSHSHSVTINNSGGHTHNVNGNTGSTGNGTALNTQDPYITVYMWKRTA